ncbi:iron ABC transporter permease [Affinibrenneria salicis]|uniref:Iron ABC transporter permease n=1 Tax=Affinibrenneria salicis TaxID=2590031 RepID=A0A5J5FT21_9GAMM|nr:iron ABC transporter permease [Affinibrenneria salicis]KAA8996632.1 iron ABC transporter permease [Affinibrenneria salicis]
MKISAGATSVPHTGGRRFFTPRRCFFLSLSLLLLGMLYSLTIGRYPIAFPTLLNFFHSLPSAPQNTLLHNLIIDTRLPRIIAAVLVGAGLSVSGAAYQAVFRNPLVSPGLLGVLSGCAFGAALGITFGLNGLWVPLLATLAGLLAVALGVGIAGLFASSSMLMLILGGIISNALFTGLLSIVKYLADPQDQLPAIVYWTLGSLSAVDNRALWLIAPPLALATLLLASCGRALDVMTLSEDEAYSLGVPVRVYRYGVIVLATLISALTVSIAGMVGWVGLLIPHLARLLVGASNVWLLPVSVCLGACFLLLCDGLARSLTAGEIPLGIITQLLGALAFVALLKSARRGWL